MSDSSKSGWKTTEFWVSLVSMGAGLAAMLGLQIDSDGLTGAVEQVVGGIIAGASALGYSLSRGLAKKS